MVTPAQERAFRAFNAQTADRQRGRWPAPAPRSRGHRPVHGPARGRRGAGPGRGPRLVPRRRVGRRTTRASWRGSRRRWAGCWRSTTAFRVGAPGGRPTSGTPSVLVAEDEAPIAAVLVDHLAEAGFAVRHARDGAEALAEIERDPPDLVISNVKMPRVDGVELARRARERAVPIPVVLIGAYGDGGGRARRGRRGQARRPGPPRGPDLADLSRPHAEPAGHRLTGLHP